MSVDQSIRRLRVGGVTKAELLSQLELSGVKLNDAARTLFCDNRFTTSDIGSLIEITVVSVANLGLDSGENYDGIVQQAATSGLSLCPLELAPHLRLQYTDQPEGFLGHPASKNRAPPGSITVASAPIADDDETPKGFYLRRIEGVLWLRGYRSWAGHLYNPEDIFAFMVGQDLA